MTVQITLSLLLAGAMSAWAADPLIGSWKIDLALTKTEPPATLTLERDGEYIHLKAGAVDARFKMDLKDYPAGRGETVYWRRIDPRTFEAVYKTGDRVTRIFRNAVAPDGKSVRTATRTISPTGSVTLNERTDVRIGGEVDPSNPLLGQWRVGEATSSSGTGILRFDAHGDGHRFVASPGYTAAYDGKDSPYAGGNSDAVSLRRVDARTIEATFKKDGKTRSVSTLAVAAEGDTMTLQSKTDGSASVTSRTYRRHTPHPLAGTWRLNVAKSNPGAQHWRSGMLRYAELPEGLRFFFNTVDADGKHSYSTGLHHGDGKPHADSAIGRRLSDRAWIRETMRDGKLFSTLKQELSEDGQVLTSTATTPQGNQARVWERDSEWVPSMPRAEEIRLGTWKVNPARTWRECPDPKPVAESVRVNTPGHFRTETRYEDGTTQLLEGDTGAGVERMRGDGRTGLSIALDHSTVENMGRKDGGLTNHSYSVVSSDGSSYTFYGWNSPPEGGRCSFLTVLERMK